MVKDDFWANSTFLWFHANEKISHIDFFLCVLFFFPSISLEITSSFRLLAGVTHREGKKFRNSVRLRAVAFFFWGGGPCLIFCLFKS